MDRREYEDVAELFKVFSTPLRVGIVAALSEREMSVQSLADTLGATQPLISQHLRILRAADLVHGERHGRDVHYRVTDEHVSHIVLDAIIHAREESHDHD